ncbi:MAG: glutathione S-transferase [Sphingomonadales bacterium]|nr:glutathione S-transferase [Sphingomonadales bacterium]
MKPYDLWYWTGIPGRGEFVRLPMEAAHIAYRDRARVEGDEAVVKHLEGMADHPAFAVPLLEGPGVKIAQTANILLYLGEKHALAPQDAAGKLWVHQLQLTIADVVVEAHAVHHPIAADLYYEDQKEAAQRAAKMFREERIPAFLDYFERAAGKGDWLVGETWTYADTSLFQLLEGLRYAFPRRMEALAKDHPKIAAIARRVAELPRLKDYLASERRLAFNEQGIFRHYPELDGP